MQNLRQMVLVFFWHQKQEWLSCTIYKILVNFSLSLDLKPGTGIQTNGSENFSCLGKNRKKVIPQKVLLFSGNFHRDELFHFNSPQNFQLSIQMVSAHYSEKGSVARIEALKARSKGTVREALLERGDIRWLILALINPN